MKWNEEDLNLLKFMCQKKGYKVKEFMNILNRNEPAIGKKSKEAVGGVACTQIHLQPPLI